MESKISLINNEKLELVEKIRIKDIEIRNLEH